MSNNLEENIDKEHELEVLRLAQHHASATRKSLLARVFTPPNTTTYQQNETDNSHMEGLKNKRMELNLS